MSKITTIKAHLAHVNVCVYGEAGVGKTRLAATAPRPLILNAERGLLSLSDLEMPVWDINRLSDLNEVIRFARDDKDHDTYFLDSLSEVGEKTLAEMKDGTKEPRQAYMQMADALWAITRQFRDIKKHVVFVCKQEFNKDEDSGKAYFRPSAPGQAFTGQIPYLFDEVFCMRIRKEGRYLQTQPDLQYSAKDRSGTLQKQEEPHLGKIFEKILTATKIPY